MYDHKKAEAEILEFWKKEKIYEKVKLANKGNEPFYFCDGPPYATGQIHPGTGWNKTIKDAICRYYRAIGRNVRSQPGYDTHGLPIEVKVEQELKFNNKGDIEKYGIEKFIEKCKSFATKHIGVMSGQFESLGVWMDFDAPYITYHDDYIESSWSTLKMAHEKGLMYEGVYVLPYCYRCETTIANYELEYDDETDPSIFVKFKVKNKDDEYLIIWTTTPWTLVANMAVMVHPTISYVRAKVGEENWIVAKERFDYLIELVQENATVNEEIPGRKLNNLAYHHPFEDKVKKKYDRRVVLSDEFVTLEEGTGLVHTAPGHGPADFVVGKRYGIEPFSPVDERGNYTKDAGDFAGKNVREANSEIIQILKSSGALVHEARIRHRYPHCWRCKTPLIFLTTKQWFISISKIKEAMMQEIEQTEWKPDFARERFKEFVSGAPDWCISRQRYWGIPLPIWKCECGKIQVIGSKEEMRLSQNSTMTAPVRELHRPYIDEIRINCSCGKKMSRILDVLDVWFDSGNAIWASMRLEEIKIYSERADLIVEGQDQIRGWFYSLLGSGVIKYGLCPYKRILMHGFFVDEKGEKMSKSIGNFIPLENIIEKYGADSFRLWGISNTIWDELKFSWEEMKKCNADLNILYNLITFMERFYPDKKIITTLKLEAIDLWVISRLNSTIKIFRHSFENCEPNVAAKEVRRFVIEDISRFYMKIAKERIVSDNNREAALFTLYKVLLTSLKMLGCLSPFICEHLYQKFFRKYEKQESMYLLPLELENSQQINSQYEKEIENIRTILSAGMLARQNADLKVRWPVRKVYVVTKSHEIFDSAKNFEGILQGLLNAKNIITVEKIPSGDLIGSDFEGGSIHLEKRIDEELYEEGIMNEIKRRIQILRKDAKLVEEDEIHVLIVAEKEIEAIVKKHEKVLEVNVNAKGINYTAEPKMVEHTIDGRIVKIAIKKS